MSAVLHNYVIQATKNEDTFNLPLGILGNLIFIFMWEQQKKKSSRF